MGAKKTSESKNRKPRSFKGKDRHIGLCNVLKIKW